MRLETINKRDSVKNIISFWYLPFRRIACVVMLFFLFIPSGHSQDDLIFDHITVTEGLTQGLVNKIYRDSRDFMWFGTLQGINRYDGINIKKFESLADDSTTITSGMVSSIFEDSRKNLWVGTANGLNRFDYSKERFIRFLHYPMKPGSLSDNSVVHISEDSKGRLWIVTRSGINLYRDITEDFERFDLPVSDQEKNPAIDAACSGNPDTIYLYSSGKIYKFCTAAGEFVMVKSGIKISEVNTLFEDPANNMWIGTENDGAFRISRSGKITHFYPEKNNSSSLQSISVKSIDPDSRKNIWISTRDGLYKLKPDGKTFIRYQNEKGNPNSLLSSYSRVFYEDRQGIIWVGTVGGVNKFNPEKLRFRHLKTSVAADIKESGTLYSNDNIIWSFYEDAGLIWIGSMRTLLSSIKEDRINSGLFSTAGFLSNGEKIIPPFNSVLEIKGDRKHNLWLGTDNGLYYYNTSSKEIRGYLHREDNENSLPDNVITSIVNCGDSVLWIGTTNGLSRFEPAKNRFTNFYNSHSDSTSLVNNLINYLFLENNKTLWIAALSGLSSFDITSQGFTSTRKISFRNMRPDLADKGRSFNEVLAIMKYKDGNYWLGTDNGLFRMNPSLKIMEHLNVQDGLPNKIVNQVQEDLNGHLWISTDNGLCCFNPASKTFRNFTVDDGLQSSEFNSNSSLVDKNGLFYFGGINGFNVFYPDSIKVSEFSPRVVITNMLLFNNPVGIDKAVNGFRLQKSIYETREVDLNYNQNFFSFEFAAIDYSNPVKIQYEYKLEGLDEGWVKCHNSHSANYTNIRPGRYTFKVRATNSDGVWSNNLAEINLSITPPFWKTKIFYLGVAFLLAFLIYIFYRLRFLNLERDKKLLEEQVQKRTHEISVINQDLKKSKSFIESVINNATYGIMVINSQGDIIMANPAVSSITGYTGEELLAMNFKSLSPPRWQKTDADMLGKLDRDKNSYIEKEYLRKDGTILPVSISTSYIKDYDIPAFVNIITDISRRVANEKELQEHRTNLEALVKERTADLIAAKERAEKADRLKTAFLSNISHEIRTPMNAIIGFSNLIKEQAWEPGQIEEFLDYITDGANNLLSIVTNIVEISKISANDITLSYKKFNFIKFISEVSSGVREKTKMKGIKFFYEPAPDISELYIVSDEAKISIVLHHLLDNALKFTQTGHIRLGYSVSENEIEVSIEDTGIGISHDLLDDIFEPFKQAESNLSRAYGGTGLGLTISKAYIEKLGGKLRVDSIPGKGSRFCFIFPLVRPENHEIAFAGATIRSENLNILIVEDEDMNFRYLAEVLKSRAKSILRAADGFSAIEQCKNNPGINLVLMDIKLPGIDGLEATVEIKKIRPDLPVIAQTAYTFVGDREKALDAGCNDFISKPINKEKLFCIINKFLKE